MKKSINEKRKTHTSTEVKQRYNKKTYNRYAVTFRRTEDADCIEFIEKEKAKGKSVSDVLKELIRKL